MHPLILSEYIESKPALPWVRKLDQIGFKRYCVIAGTIAVSGSMALLGMAVVANDLFKFAPPLHGFAERPGIWTIVGNLVFAPVIETVLLIGLLKLLVRIRLREVVAIVVSAILWGALHGTLAPLRFFGSIWSFAVFGYSYFFWRHRQPDRGFAAASVTHGLVNAVSTIFIFVDYYAFRIGG